MNLAYLLLGTNEGNRTGFIEKAIQEIKKNLGLIINQSSIYETAAWGKEDQAAFLNQVLLVETKYDTIETLAKIQAIEKTLGRQRKIKWGARTIDIDILYFNDAIIDEPDLQIPHPRLHERAFTLIPMVEIAPDLIHPVLKLNQKELLLKCKDSLEVKIFEP
jgi:2-amino-4-hydroxy-6-hydroxymethyldihydropteridine diphosphokinase